MNAFLNWYQKPAVNWLLHTAFYMVILFALIVIYGFAAAKTGTFIYSDF
ncbi:MAG: teichoic acid D-Ala incorporation-associated protein DltX [Sporolactobacillus sp.]